jgi:probable rRNA maturation factor
MSTQPAEDRAGTAPPPRPRRARRVPRIDVAEQCADWAAAVPRARALSRRAALAALAAVPPSLSGDAEPELSLVLGDDALMRRLNREWRRKDAPTNVLAFPAQDFVAGAPATAREGKVAGAPLLLGDVVLGFETVQREATAQGKALADHLAHLVVHGVLHLLGFDHETLTDAARMEGLERRVLAGMGIADPYEPSLDDRRDAPAGRRAHG